MFGVADCGAFCTSIMIHDFAGCFSKTFQQYTLLAAEYFTFAPVFIQYLHFTVGLHRFFCGNEYFLHLLNRTEQYKFL